MITVKQILRNNYVEGQFFHSHVSLVQPRGKFQFNRKNWELLWDVYCEQIMNKDNDEIFGIAEKPQTYLPVLVDIDIKIKDDEKSDYGEHLYTNEQLEKVISIYQSVLRKIVEDCDEDHLKCCVLEKPLYYITSGEELTYIKNGFHLHFPGVFLSKVDQEVHLIPRVKECIKSENVFQELGIEDSSSVIDDSCCKVPWLIYGSRKSEEQEPYIFSRVVSADGCDLLLEEAFENYKIFDMNEEPINIKGRVREYLPRILSIVPHGREENEVISGLPCPTKIRIKSNVKKVVSIRSEANIESDLNLCKKLVDMLSNYRAEKYDYWLKIGYILYNVSEGSIKGYEIWDDFSSRCEEKYNEASCRHEWERMYIKNDGLTIATLKFWAKEDSPEEFTSFSSDNTKPFIIKCLNGSHNDVAQLLYNDNDYGTRFKCPSIANKTWYYFNDNNWELSEEGTCLRSLISSDQIISKFVDYAKMSATASVNVMEDKVEYAAKKKEMDKSQKMVANLKSAPFKNNVMRECMEVFYDDKFAQKLDQNPFLIGFKNGVYDLKLNIFRKGIPEDYINKCIPIEYKEYDESHDDVQSIIDFLKKVFPDSSVRNYFLDTYSEIFVGGNSQKKVYLWTGDGDNGKSITQTFFDKMLGDHAIKFNTQYFTGKKTSSGSANPELARACPPVRHATMEEPDADEQLNIGELKKLSGGDSYWARDLFEKGKSTREVFPMFTLTFICNKLPKLRYSDRATWNRLRVIPFESTFVEPGKPCPITFEEQMLEKRFPMDKTFGSKIPELVGAFAWYLLEWRKKVSVRIEPDKVRQATLQYQKENDIYRQFIEENIIKSETNLSLSDLYNNFKDWFKEGWPNSSLPIKNEIKDYFEKLWGPIRGNKWFGYRIKNYEEELENGDIVEL